MSRAPELGDECRPGGSCPVCNAPDPVCGWCGNNPLEDGADRCSECAEQQRQELNGDQSESIPGGSIADLLEDRPSHATEPPEEE